MTETALSAIAGLGFSEIGREPLAPPASLALRAMRDAVMDSGIPLPEIDGLLLNQSAQVAGDAVPLALRERLGLHRLRLLASLDSKGASAILMLQQATLAIRAGMANAVLCVFADSPVGNAGNSGGAYVNAASLTGIAGWDARYGLVGAVANYAMAARRYMALYGADERHLGASAIAARKWAVDNPMAVRREPLDMETYLASRFVVEPFRLLDCAMPVNGAAAVVVTTPDRARDAARPPVYLHGFGQAHGRFDQPPPDDPTNEETPGTISARDALEMARLAPADITCCQVYDAFSFSVFVALEDFGICRRGEAAGFVLDGGTAPGGAIPVSTGGGHLSGFYLQGMTPVAEAIVQARGSGGARQVPANDAILANGSGGLFEHHTAAVFSPHLALG